MRTSVWLVSVAALIGCSATDSSKSSRMQVKSAGSAGAPAAAMSGIVPGKGPDTNSVLIETSKAPPAPVDSGIVEPGCEVGKFCKPTTPDPENCGTLTLGQEIQVKKIPGNLLLVFDQSVSMSEPWGTSGQTKLTAAQAAIRNAIMSLQDSLTVGAIFFPTYACAARGGPGIGSGGLPGGAQLPGAGLPGGGPGGVLMGITGMAVEPITGMGQIPFHPATEFLPMWDEHWNMAGAGTGVGTPMQEAFDRANEALATAQLQGDVAVVAVTDGAPNCFPGGDTTDLEVNRAAKWLTDRGVKTYVVGLPGAAGVQLLNDVAAQGGTTEYILPDDPKQLEDRLRTLIQETNKVVFDTCSIHLTPAADPADQLLMVVKEAKDDSLHQVPHELTPTAGWTITPDGMQVEIVGDLCADAMNGRFTSITFQYPCKEGEPIPPLSPS
ncbi:MAG TPA: vWA domain-containing protein [Polyangiales bacterium]|nr:vWA domain-containing protein [Polyangiales bacterium]